MDEPLVSGERPKLLGCRFCYPPEPWRVISSTPHFNVQMGLGPLAEGYALILSRLHYSCCAEVPESQAVEFENLVRIVRQAQINLYGASPLPLTSGTYVCFREI